MLTILPKISLGLILAIALLIGLGNVGKSYAKNSKTHKVKTEKIKLDVKGTACSGCAVHVESALKKIDGVKKVKVKAKKARVEVEYDPKVTETQKIVEAIKKMGYEASVPPKTKKAAASCYVQ